MAMAAHFPSRPQEAPCCFCEKEWLCFPPAPALYMTLWRAWKLSVLQETMAMAAHFSSYPLQLYSSTYGDPLRFWRRPPDAPPPPLLSRLPSATFSSLPIPFSHPSLAYSTVSACVQFKSRPRQSTASHSRPLLLLLPLTLTHLIHSCALPLLLVGYPISYSQWNSSRTNTFPVRCGASSSSSLSSSRCSNQGPSCRRKVATNFANFSITSHNIAHPNP